MSDLRNSAEYIRQIESGEVAEQIFDHHAAAVRHEQRHEPSWLFRLRTNPEPLVFWTCMAAVGALIALGVL